QQPEELRAGAIPGRLVRLVHRCLAKAPEQRPESFDKIVEALEEVLRDPRLAPPSAETVPIKTYPAGLPRSYRPAPAQLDSALPLRPKQGSRLGDVAIRSSRPVLRDSSNRIQVARRPRRAGRVLLSLALVFGIPPSYLYFGGPLPDSVSSELTQLRDRLPEGIQAWLELFNQPGPAPGPVGVGTANPEPRVSAESAGVPPPAQVETEPPPDPVTAAIAVLESQKSPVESAPVASPRTRRLAPANTPATIFLPPSWHAEMTVSIDGGASQPLDRRHTRRLRPGPHKLIFRLDTPSYQVRRSLDLELEPGETRSIESPLAPPAALRVEVLPGSVAGRVEIDGRSFDLPLETPQVLEPGSHRLALHASPADALGPLTKTVDLDSATVHLVTFDMRRRRAVLESQETFEWGGN
ncbi:MAG: hypothetical protein GY769_19250, partial [bacterium]|nr:hypothetical protein [bacterium]